MWLNEEASIRLWPERANHGWSYDFVKAMTHDGRSLRRLVLLDEYTRECLAIPVARRLGSGEVIETLADVILLAEMAFEMPATTRVFGAGAVPSSHLDYKPDAACRPALSLLRHITLDEEWRKFREKTCSARSTCWDWLKCRPSIFSRWR